MRTWNNVDKSKWPDGPWNSEPDRAQWIDEASGLDCLITRNDLGNLCGYVGVPESHPLFQEHYEGAPLQVHGGVTFAAPCDPGEAPDQGICHTGEVANEMVWWFGFDCAHAFDLKPALAAMDEELGISLTNFPGILKQEKYRDFPYVVEQVKSLAAQLATMAKPATNDETSHG